MLRGIERGEGVPVPWERVEGKIVPEHEDSAFLSVPVVPGEVVVGDPAEDPEPRGAVRVRGSRRDGVRGPGNRESSSVG